jgi:hypothetical protein
VTHACPKCGGPATPIIGQYVACKRCDAKKKKPAGWADRVAASELGWTSVRAERQTHTFTTIVTGYCWRCETGKSVEFSDAAVEDSASVDDFVAVAISAMRHDVCKRMP